MVRRLQFVDVALWRFVVDPVEEARDRRAVALLCGFLAGDLGRVLDRLGQDGRIAQRQNLGAGPIERVEDRRYGALGIDDDGLALELAKRAFEFRPLVEADAVAEVLADVRPDLLAGDEQVGGAVGIHQRVSERDRRVGHVLAADVERPGDRIERRQHRRVGVLLHQPVADLGALLGRRLAGILVGLDDQMRFRGLGPVLPDFVDRVLLDRDQLGAAAGERFLRFLHPVAGVEPRIVADPRAFRRMLLEPFGRAGLGHRLVAPLGRADLLADLQRVAAVDEDRGFLGSTTADPAEPSNPVSQASRWA